MQGRELDKINEKIKARRLALGLTDVSVAEELGVSIAAYIDIEGDESEILTLIPLNKVRKLCDILHLNCLELFGLSCAFCETNQNTYYEKNGRDELIKTKRLEKGLTTEDLADRVGYYGASIEAIEAGDTNHLDSWVFEEVLDLAKNLDLPPQLLLGFKCSRCGR